jgi:hypothetical protein
LGGGGGRAGAIRKSMRTLYAELF